MGRCERIVILYNEPVLPESHPDYQAEVEILANVAAVQKALIAAGYEVARLGVTADPQVLLAGLRDHRPDAVVNLFEGTADNNASELYACGLLEWLGVPYTGCPFPSLVLARSKHVAKRLFLAEGVPTAPFLVVEDQVPVDRCVLNFPLILKPAQQDASVGVDQQSVVTDLEGLNQRATFLIEQFGGPVLVEEFIFGREVTVGLAELPDLRVLPATEAIFPEEAGYWPILSYDAKWAPGSAEYVSTNYRFATTLEPGLAEMVSQTARRVFRLLDCRDYARVDFRIRASDGQPFVLEVNPNPSFAPECGLANNLEVAGISHAEFVVQLVRNALARGGGVSSVRYRDQRLDCQSPRDLSA
jgi:D-alanine-D-alanine ligase